MIADVDVGVQQKTDVIANKMENLYSVIITAITVLGGTSAFRFYEKRALKKERDEDFIKTDCRDRISKLEALLSQSSKEKDELRTMVIEMTAKIAELTVRVDYLTRENDKLEKSIPKPKRQING
jgi:peptidoglycan hydrolase CwlO-like protein